MNATMDILRGELERLYTLEEMTAMSRTLLALDPEEVGGATAKATFARALAERCLSADRVEALVDVLVSSRRELDPRVREVGTLLSRSDAKPGQSVGAFMLAKKVGEGDVGVVFSAERVGNALTELEEASAIFVKVIHAEAARDRRALHRFLTNTRLLAQVRHAGLPRLLEAGETPEGSGYVAYEAFDGQSLAQRLSRTGPSHINELRPILRAILEPLAALHAAQKTHGDLKLENVLIGRVAGIGGASGLRVCILDAGTDRLRLQGVSVPGRPASRVTMLGPSRSTAPEQLRGMAYGPRADVYAFGTMMYELVSGKPVFATDNGADPAFLPLWKEPEPPSVKAPRGWVPREVRHVRPRAPREGPGGAAPRRSGAPRCRRVSRAHEPAVEPLPVGTARGDRDVDRPHRRSADRWRRGHGARGRGRGGDGGGQDRRSLRRPPANACDALATEGNDLRETKKGLLYRAARTYDHSAQDKAKAEEVYRAILTVDPSDDVAEAALVEITKQLGKYEEVIELLLARSQAAPAGEARGRALSDIGRLCATELDDSEQALVAYGQALTESPGEEGYAHEIERLAGDDSARWTEVLASLTEAVKDEKRPSDDRKRSPGSLRSLVRRPGWPRGPCAHGVPAGARDRSRKRAGERGADRALSEVAGLARPRGRPHEARGGRRAAAPRTRPPDRRSRGLGDPHRRREASEGDLRRRHHAGPGARQGGRRARPDRREGRRL